MLELGPQMQAGLESGPYRGHAKGHCSSSEGTGFKFRSRRSGEHGMQLALAGSICAGK